MFSIANLYIYCIENLSAKKKREQNLI